MPIEKIYNETRLLSMLSEGSEYAFRELFNTYKDHLYRIALAYVKQPQIAEEVVQDVFMTVWIHKEELGSINSFKSWIYTIGRNKIIDRYKRIILDNKVRAEYMYPLPKEDNSTYYNIINKEYEKILQKGISQLPERQRQVYELVKENGLSYKDAAEKLNISQLTVKTHLTRSMNFLRNFIRQNGELICLIYLMKNM